ncbi:ATP-binding protein [Pseudoalteromonas sp. SR41-4]|uniref:sensor histidine kinase n=1 Tax=Pseudoalteromonas sp. SR41-4 TaxID=2760950 RepID=UPI0016030217|nr:ATP-binding protein [Pseudoalteromonas sp. SR41-4]MBB1292181.1 hypothetical protein [Pseudoalteromonas sp. SR41-4]
MSVKTRLYSGLFFIVYCLFSTGVSAHDTPKNMTQVVQGKNGFMYFASHEGLYKYDGYHFALVESLPGEWVYSLTSNADKSTLYAASNGRIYAYDVLTGLAESFADVNSKDMAVNGSHVYAATAQGVEVISKKGTGHLQALVGQTVFKVISHDGQVYALTNTGLWHLNLNHQRQLIKMTVHSGLIAAVSDRLYVAHENTLYSFDLITEQVQQTSLETTPSAMTIYKNSYLAMAMAGEVRLYSTLDKQFVAGVLNKSKLFFNSVYADSQSNLWAVADNEYEIITQDLNQFNLPLVSRYNVLSRDNDSLLMGTDAGVYRFIQRQFVAMDALNNSLKYAQSSEVTTIASDKVMLVGTTNGLYVWQNAQLTKLLDGYILGIERIAGCWLIATSDQGVVVIDDNLMVEKVLNVESGLAANEILATNKFEHLLYISTSNGLSVYNVKTGNISHSLTAQIGKVSKVTMLGNNVYVAVYGGGLYKQTSNGFTLLTSPRFITDLSVFNANLYIATTNGLFTLVDDSVVAIPHTEKQYFGANSLMAYNGAMYGVSNNGLLGLSDTNLQNDKRIAVSSIDVNSDRVSMLESVQQASQLTLYFSNFDYALAQYYDYQYSHNNGDWISVNEPVVHFTQLNEGEHSIVMRGSLDGKHFTQSDPITWRVTGPFYQSSVFISFCGALIITLFGVLSLVFIKRHRQMREVFRRMRDTKQQTALSLGFRKLVAGSHLCQGDDLQLSDGLLQLDEAKDILLPVVFSHGALGNTSLDDGLRMLSANTSLQYSQTEVEFNLALGTKALPEKLSQDIYAFINHAFINALQHAQARYIEVSGKRSKNDFVITVQDDGKGIAFLDQFMRFGTGLESMHDIARSLDGRLTVRKGKMNGTVVQLRFSISEKAATRKAKEVAKTL